jgi:tripartite-type tricarboxylate transporter receptor subunit TctC
VSSKKRAIFCAWRFGAVAVLSACALAVLAQDAHTQFPTRPIRIIVPSAAGGALDAATRLLAAIMESRLGQSIIIDNRPGGDSLLGIRVAKDAPADEYTLLAHTSTMMALPALKQDPGFDMFRDFMPVGAAQRAPNVLAVSADLGIKDLAEFIRRAKTEKFSYGSAGVGSTLHINGAMFGLREGVDMMHVPYKGSAAAMPDVVAGRVTAIFGGLSGLAPYLESGKMRALAVTGDKRLEALPEVRTLQEQGVNFTYTYWLGLFAPAKTPRPVVQKLSEALISATESREVRERFAADGASVWRTTAEEFSRHLQIEVKLTADLIQTLKIAKE